MKTSKNRLGLVVMVLLCVGGVGAVAYYVKNAPAQKIDVDELKPEFAVKQRKHDSVQTPNPMFTKEGDIGFYGENKEPTPGVDEKLFVVNDFLANLEGKAIHADSIEYDHGVAKIQFPANTTFDLGSQDEATFLLGLRSALGQFAEVESVELYVGGQKLDEMGHEVLDGPMPVIRPPNWRNPTKPASARGPSEGN